MKLIVGLGNPGKKYENTRHNAGFLAMDFLAKHYGFDAFKEVSKHKAELVEGSIDGEKVMLMKPQTFMNLSGQAVRLVMQFYKIDLADAVMIYDDKDIASGNLRIRQGGSAAGHNGVKSLMQELGDENFMRVRLGIAPLEPFKGDLEDYVLGQLNDEEQLLLEGNLKKLPVVVEMLMRGELEECMREFN